MNLSKHSIELVQVYLIALNYPRYFIETHLLKFSIFSFSEFMDAINFSQFNFIGNYNCDFALENLSLSIFSFCSLLFVIIHYYQIIFLFIMFSNVFCLNGNK